MNDTYAAYKQKAEAQFEQLQARIDELKARAKDATADVRIALDEKVRDLDERMIDGRRQISEYSEDNQSGWDSFRDKVDGIIDGIRTKLD